MFSRRAKALRSLKKFFFYLGDLLIAQSEAENVFTNIRFQGESMTHSMICSVLMQRSYMHIYTLHRRREVSNIGGGGGEGGGKA